MRLDKFTQVRSGAVYPGTSDVHSSMQFGKLATNTARLSAAAYQDVSIADETTCETFMILLFLFQL